MSAILKTGPCIDDNYSGWQAELELGFEQSPAKTLLVNRRHSGPLTVQRPFYPEGDVCHVYVLHPPGGIVSGDRLAINVNAGQGSAALITTPAAGKFYRSSGNKACQSVRIDVAENAAVEWLPQETIIFEGACVSSSLTIDLANNARFIGWEILSLGRPASAEAFTCGTAELRWQINREGLPFYLERLLLDAVSISARWGLNGQSACGTMFAGPASSASLEAVTLLIGDAPNRGITRIDDFLICRATDTRTDRIRQFFEQIWEIIRYDIVHRNACAPRIWAT